MVGSSNVISREICRVLRTWTSTVKFRSGGHCVINGPEARRRISHADKGSKPAISVAWKKRHDRSQSSHSSNEAVQHNAVEPRGTGQ